MDRKTPTRLVGPPGVAVVSVADRMAELEEEVAAMVAALQARHDHQPHVRATTSTTSSKAVSVADRMAELEEKVAVISVADRMAELEEKVAAMEARGRVF
eukprot:686985-Prymnesium_polylepis.1